MAAAVQAKDKAIANNYQVMLVVNEQGRVKEVLTEQEMPEKLKLKAKKTFYDKKLGVKKVDGVAIEYKQKFVVNTKHLFGDSRVTQK